MEIGMTWNTDLFNLSFHSLFLPTYTFSLCVCSPISFLSLFFSLSPSISSSSPHSLFLSHAPKWVTELASCLPLSTPFNRDGRKRFINLPHQYPFPLLSDLLPKQQTYHNTYQQPLWATTSMDQHKITLSNHFTSPVITTHSWPGLIGHWLGYKKYCFWHQMSRLSCGQAPGITGHTKKNNHVPPQPFVMLPTC